MPVRRAETLKGRFSNAEKPGIFGQSPARLPEISATLGGYKPPLGSVMAHAPPFQSFSCQSPTPFLPLYLLLS